MTNFLSLTRMRIQLTLRNKMFLFFTVLMPFAFFFLYAGVFAQGTEPEKGRTEPSAAGVAALAEFYDRFQQVLVHHIKSQAGNIAVGDGQ